MMEIIKGIYETNKNEYEFIGLRFENKQRETNEICECSKNNPNREDERDFPQFGTEEYNNYATWNGTSAWDLSEKHTTKVNSWESNKETDCCYIDEAHCYIVAGNYNCNSDDGLDDYEIVIEDAKVIAVIF